MNVLTDITGAGIDFDSLDLSNFLTKQEAETRFVNVTGDSFTGSATLNMNNNKIINLSNPIDKNDAVNKQYVDDKLIISPNDIKINVYTGHLNTITKKFNLPNDTGIILKQFFIVGTELIENDMFRIINRNYVYIGNVLPVY